MTFCMELKSIHAYGTFLRFGFSILILSLLVLIIISTWLDTELNDNESNTSTFREMMLCFSARRNFKNIFKISYSHPGIDSLHLARFILTMLVLFAHLTLQYFATPTINFTYIEQVSLLQF